MIFTEINLFLSKKDNPHEYFLSELLAVSNFFCNFAYAK